MSVSAFFEMPESLFQAQKIERVPSEVLLKKVLKRYSLISHFSQQLTDSKGVFMTADRRRVEWFLAFFPYLLPCELRK